MGLTPAISVLFFTLAFAAMAADTHPHSGAVSPFVPGRPGIRLDSTATHVLETGAPYQTAMQLPGTTARPVAIQDVRASPDIVWGKILDFDRYHDMVPDTLESKVYEKQVNDLNGFQRILARLSAGTSMFKLDFFVDARYDPASSCMTWTLDYSKKSDLHDSVGYWHVAPHPERSDWSRVYHSTETSLFAWIPSFIGKKITKTATIGGLKWVKEHSERHQKELLLRRKMALARRGGDNPNQEDVLALDAAEEKANANPK